MPLARVQIEEDKAAFVRGLKASEDSEGLFQTYAEILTFAAFLGISRNRRVPLTKFSRKDPDAVPQDQFKAPQVINLVATYFTQDLQLLADDEESDFIRVRIFQEYANGGLEILQKELSGAVDYTERIMMLLKTEDFQKY
jgi:dnd system-associated protein 4